jgi:16S rRNA processing protein RimM
MGEPTGPTEKDERVQIGFVARAHGVRGALRVRADSDVLLDLDEVWLDGRRVKIVARQRERKDFLIQIEGVTDRDQADALRGAAVEVRRADLPAPADDEVYVADQVGCQVFDGGGARLGEVVETFFSGAHELLSVRDGEREFLLPFVDGIVTEVDVAGRRIVCAPPEGLVDLERADSDRERS